MLNDMEDKGWVEKVDDTPLPPRSCESDSSGDSDDAPPLQSDSESEDSESENSEGDHVSGTASIGNNGYHVYKLNHKGPIWRPNITTRELNIEEHMKLWEPHRIHRDQELDNDSDEGYDTDESLPGLITKCAECTRANTLTERDQHAEQELNMGAKPPHGHCHYCDTVARVEYANICAACGEQVANVAPTEAMHVGDENVDGDRTVSCVDDVLTQRSWV
jgi:hypothetical protein